MFILFGSKIVKSVVKDGLSLRKRCAKCQLLSDLQEHSFRQFFTIFFIPIFPISKGESLLVCKRCGATFYIQPEDHVEALAENSSRSLAPDAEKLVIVCDHCEGRLRIPMTERRLRVTCPHCKREFET